MHHSLRFYSRNQHTVLKLYTTLIKLADIPLVGRAVHWVAEKYAHREHHGYILTIDQAEQIIDAAQNVALGPCSCRQIFHNCDEPVLSEIVIGTGGQIFSEVRPNEFTQISKSEAKKIVRHAHRNKLLSTIMQCQQDFYALCSCCKCCCVPVRLRRDYNIGAVLVRDPDIVNRFRSYELNDRH